MLAAKYSMFTCTPIVAGHYARPELPTTSDNEEKRDGYKPIKVNRCVIIVIDNARPVYIYHSIPFPPSPPIKRGRKQETRKRKGNNRPTASYDSFPQERL
jgi:hypothetical protein